MTIIAGIMVATVLKATTFWSWDSFTAGVLAGVLLVWFLKSVQISLKKISSKKAKK
jgi:hypothetical protein